jgi:hypothetical protein
MTSQTMARIMAIIRENERIGVSTSRRWDPDMEEPSEAVAIYWHPGDPNYLAQAIIRNVGEAEMRLELDGNVYMIRKIS